MPSPALCFQALPCAIEFGSFPWESTRHPILTFKVTKCSRVSTCGRASLFFCSWGAPLYKGLHTLLRAAADVGARVVIAGSGPEGGALREQAQRLGLSGVVFAGQVTDEEKVALLKSCRALVLPSHLRSEAFGMVLVEASMFGSP